MYRTGTVSINPGDTQLVGTNTEWVSVANLQPGYLINLPDNLLYLVTSVTDDEHIDIERLLDGQAYSGNALTDVQYAAILTSLPQIDASLAYKQVQLLSQWREYIKNMQNWLFTQSSTANLTTHTGQSLEVLTPAGIESMLSSNVAVYATVAEVVSIDLDVGDEIKCVEREYAHYTVVGSDHTPVLGDITLNNGNYLQLRIDVFFNIAWLGAPKGTGSDAYPFFNYLESLNEVDTIVCVGGTYRIDTSLTLTKNLILKNGAVFSPSVGVAFFTTGSVNGNPGEDVVLLGGQSNAQGAADQSTLDAALNRTWHNCQIFGGSNFVALGPTTNQSNNGKHGIEFELARKYAQQGRRLWLIKYSMGGTALDDNPSNDNNWFPNRGNLNRIFFEDWIRPALGKLARENIHIKFVWCQGEADSAGSNVGMARRYEQNLLEFFGQVIDAVSPVQICIIRTNGNISGFVNVADVQQAQTRVSDMIPNCFWIDTDNTELQGDNLHFTSAGYSDIASRVFNVLSKKTTGLTKALNIPPWKRRLLLNPRREGVGATAFATPITVSTVDNQSSTGLGIGMTLTGKSLLNTYYTVAVAEITAWPGGSSVEANIEVVPASGGLGGLIVAGDWDGTELTGYFIRMATNEIRVFNLADSTAELLAVEAITGNTNIPMGLRVEAGNGVINVYVKTPNVNWKNVLSFDADIHAGSRLFITSGWGDSDETGVRFGNIRPIGEH